MVRMKKDDFRTEELDRLREVYRENPDDRDTGAKLGQLYTDIGWLNEAAEVLRDLTERFYGDYPLLLDYGNLCCRRRQYDEAVRVFGELVGLRPERIEGWNNLGIVQLIQGNYEGARDSFSQVLELEPDNCGALLNLGNYYDKMGDLDKATGYFERAVSVRKDFADGWYNLGNAYLESGKDQKAIEAFEKALRYQPEFGSALKNLGFAYEKVENLEQAEEHYLRALELNKGDAALYINLATIYTSTSRYDKAKDFFLRAVKLAPKDAGGWMGLRHLSLLKGDINTFVRATLAVMHRLSAADVAGSIRRLRELEHFEKAGEILKQADRLALEGDELDAERLLNYQRSGKNGDKIAPLVERLRAIPDPTDEVRAGLGAYYLEIGEVDVAAGILGCVKEKSLAVLRAYWTALERLEKLAEARESIEGYLSDNQDCAEAWLYFAQVALKEGRLSEAQSYLVKAKRLGFVDLELLESLPELKRMYEALGGSVS
ncbi:MAG: tetratricopeptide repeat protein [Chitinivibrionales bacterium]|nr:tetratricopeptide repeat protein [Chitinivibrionales bacterium]MBD3355904.1 tetratricopeptide repeat protein [Chitinivibrionales bacterium]